MSIYCRKVVRGCGLILGLLLLILILSPALAYRLQNHNQAKDSKRSSSQSLKSINQSSQSHNKSEAKTLRNSAPWPPRIPLWGFLPQSSSSNSNTKPSKRDSSSHQSLSSSPFQHKGSGVLGHAFSPEDVPFDEEDEDYDDSWIVNLKRSTNPGQRSTAKRTRMYDVPQIECPPAEDGMERFACPTPDKLGRYPCVDDHVLCDGFVDCPGREDEDRQACMFYKTTKAHLDVLADALLRWARGKR